MIVEGSYVIEKLFQHTEENVRSVDAEVQTGGKWRINSFTAPTAGFPFICQIGNEDVYLRTTSVLSVFQKDTDNDKLIIPSEFVNLVLDKNYDIMFATRNSVYGILKVDEK